MITFGCLCFLRPVGNLNQVIQVACGDQHSIALTQDGNVFTWGQNSSGQLGLGKGEPSTLSPQPVKSLSGIPLAQITAGGDHSFALSLSGAVFSWGKNSTGQLGLGDTIGTVYTNITIMFGPMMSCWLPSHTVETFISTTGGGLVFTFGSGRHGQLGHNSLRNELRPRLVAELWGAKVTQIACGRNHTLAFVGSFKKIYSFGRGEQGQLGNGVKMDQSVPLPVQLPQVLNIVLMQCIKLLLQESGKGLNDSNLGKVTQTLDGDIINRWISDCDSTSWKKIQKEITKTFSSASCLNGSFLDKSRDKHYQTSLKHSGLDLSFARLAFQKLAQKDKVEDVVQRILLPSLSKDPIGVEGLRVYLIIPELLRVLLKQHRIDIIGAFVFAILRLNPDKFQVLEGLWSTLPDTPFRTLVKTFHYVSAEYLRMMAEEVCDVKETFEGTVKVMERLYEVNIHCHNWVPFRKYSYLLTYSTFCSYFFGLQVKFQAENGVDEGGVSLEFFRLLGRELLKMEPKTLEVYESGLAWFTTDDGGITDEFYLLGLLCGKALFSQCVLNLCFPLALFKKLLGLTTTLDDLKELSPTEARGLQDVLDEDEEVVEAMDVVFMYKGQELIPNGEKVPLTMVNRKKYVDLYVDMKLNKSVQSQFADFEKGFHKGFPIQAWRMFLPEELMTLLQGDDNYEWDKLRENAQYQGYRPTDDIIQNFWIVFMEFSEEQKKKFLTFLTGTDRLPRGRSLSKLQMQITCLGSTEADEYYPKAQTCSVTLCLPNYSSIDILREKLLHAITHCDAFGDF
uniref:Probable E3 ubiquitin-protein ligase HERC3 n=1 Tax=Salmo trutta TaxID=8032 RepID=A0A673YYK1_SALTR